MSYGQGTRLFFSAIALLLCFHAGCVSPRGDSINEKKAVAQQMRSEALDTFYRMMPQMREQLARAPGYAVFSGTGTHTVFMTTGQGFGIVRDNRTGKDTYMSAVKLGGGLGVGLVDVRAVVVFTDPAVMRDFVELGWGVTGKAEAVAQTTTTGDQRSMVISLPGMSIYRFSKQGAMIGGAIEGTKVWKDPELN